MAKRIIEVMESATARNGIAVVGGFFFVIPRTPRVLQRAA